MGIDSVRREEIDLKPGDVVTINSGHMEGFSGKVTDVDNDTRKIKLALSMFGRETSVEIDCSQVEKMD
jgi:transcriptional antiterminator NusG